MTSMERDSKVATGMSKPFYGLERGVSITLGMLGLCYGAWYIWMVPRQGISCLSFRGENLIIALPCAAGAICLGHLRRFKLGYWSGYGAAALALIALFVPRPHANNDASAVGALRTLNTAEVTYSATYNGGFSPSLAALGPSTTPGANPTAGAAGLIDSVLASGEKSAFRFVYSPGPRDEKGYITSYSVTASPIQPGVTGTNYYFTDQTGVIRWNSTGPAGPKDPPLAG